MKKWMIGVVVIVMVLLIVLASQQASAAPVGKLVVVYQGRYDQFHPAVVYVPQAGEYWVVWSGRGGSNSWDVFLQRLRADGQLTGELTLVCPCEGQQFGPAISAGENAVLISWTDWRSQENRYGVSYRLFNFDGTPRGGERFLSRYSPHRGQVALSGTTAATPSQYPAASVAYDQDADRWLIVGWDLGHTITGHLVSGYGTLLQSKVVAKGYSPAVSYGGDVFAVAYVTVGPWDVAASLINRDLQVIHEVLISNAPNHTSQFRPRITWRPQGEMFFVHYTDSRWRQVEPSAGWDISGRLVSPGGQLGSEIFITKELGSQSDSMAFPIAGKLFVAWLDSSQYPNWQIRARPIWLDSSGVSFGKIEVLTDNLAIWGLTGLGEPLVSPAMARGTTGGLVVWVGLGAERGNGWELFARRFTFPATPVPIPPQK